MSSKLEKFRQTRAEKEKVDNVFSMLQKYSDAMLMQEPEDIYQFSHKFFERHCDKSRRASKSPSLKSLLIVPHSTMSSQTTFMSLLSSDDKKFRHDTVFASIAESSELPNDFVEFSKTNQQKSTLREMLKNVTIFDNWTEALVDELIGSFMMQRFEADEHILKQGEPLHYFFVVEEGELKGYQKNWKTGVEKLKEIYLTGSSFGHEALLHTNFSKYTIVGVKSGTLWIIENHKYREVEFKYRRKEREKFECITSTVDILKNLARHERDQIVDAFEVNIYNIGDVVIRDTSETHGMYFIENGTVSLSYYNEDVMNFVEVAKASSGEYFGEMSLLNKEDKNIFKITAIEPTIIAFLNRERFHRLLEKSCIKQLKTNTSKLKSLFKELMGISMEDAVKAKYNSKTSA